jgi:pyruvate,water dikinase
MRRFSGRFYFDLAILQWCMYDAIGIMPAETNRTTGGFQPEIDVPVGNPLAGRMGRKRRWRRLQMLRGLARFRRRLPKLIETVLQENRQTRTVDLSALTDRQLLMEFRRRVAIGNDFTPAIQLAAAYYGAWMTVLQDLLGRVTGNRQQSLVTRLLAASGDVASAEHGYRLVELTKLIHADPLAQDTLIPDDPFAWRQLSDHSEFRRAFELYLEEFGHRGVCEMDCYSNCKDCFPWGHTLIPDNGLPGFGNKQNTNSANSHGPFVLWFAGCWTKHVEVPHCEKQRKAPQRQASKSCDCACWKSGEE